jgi:hypothetical protein
MQHAVGDSESEQSSELIPSRIWVKFREKTEIILESRAEVVNLATNLERILEAC